MRAIINLDHNRSLDMWECDKQLQEIRRYVCSEPLSDIEFGLLVQLGRSTGLNPFNKEIWVIKYSAKAPAQIFISRDGYRKGAQRNPEYEFHESYAVYSKDEFRVCNGEIQHNYGLANRGELVGAYCLVKRKSSNKPTHVMVSMSEYYQPQGLWKTKPETMIKKVAEAQALRQSFQETFTGTYSDAELPQEPKVNNVRQITGNTQTEKLKNLLNITAIQEVPNDLTYWLNASGVSDDRIDKALEHYGVDLLEELSFEQQQNFIENLKKISDRSSQQQ